MTKEISLDAVALAERPQWFVQGVKNCITYLAATFPAEQGYVHYMQVCDSEWTEYTQSDWKVLAMLESVLRKAPDLDHNLRVTKGRNWGISILIQTANGNLSVCYLSVVAQTPLALNLSCIGTMLGFVITFGIMVWGSFEAGLIIGLAAGMVLLSGAWLISRPLQMPTRMQVSELLDTLALQLVNRPDRSVFSDAAK